MEKTQRREVNVDRMRLTGNKPEGWITRLKRFDDVTIGKERYSFWVEGEGDEMFFYLAREGHGLRDGLFTYDATISVERQIVAGEECMKITSAMTAKGLRGRGLYSALKKNALQYIEDNVDNYAKIIEQDIIDTNPIYREVVKSAETGASLMDNDKILRHFEYVSGKKITDIRGEGVITANGYEYHLVVSLENH
jgi:predicted GNAT family acetyltransferase